MGATAIGSMEYTIARSYEEAGRGSRDRVGGDPADLNTIQAMAVGQIDGLDHRRRSPLQLHPNLKILVDAETLAKVN
jgi:hypothetical protein